MDRAQNILVRLKKLYPLAAIALDYRNVMQLLAATILSAQCTDKRVNIVTKGLFKKYKRPADFAGARMREFQKEIRSTGFYRQKAKNIINSAKIIVNEHGGKVPDSMDKLLKLPGVARKTANIVLLHGYGLAAGIAVDTHVRRLSLRFAFTKHNDPVKIENDLMNIFHKKEWRTLSNLLIAHGREVCFARKPDCAGCGINALCPSSEVR